jgi:hypothetical protein
VFVKRRASASSGDWHEGIENRTTPQMRKGTAARLMLLAPILASLGIMPLSAALAATGAPSGRPAVSTAGATHVKGTSATLTGAVNPRGAATTYYFQFGPTVAYGRLTPAASLPSGSKSVKVGQAVTGLLPGYHYRLVATNEHGLTDGKDRTFATNKVTKSKFTLPKGSPPTVFGSAFRLTGSISGAANANRELELQASPFPYLAAFTTIGAPVFTNTLGQFTFTVPSLSASTQFRVSTLDARPVYSSVLSQEVAVRVTLKVRTTSHKGLVRLFGTVTPAKVGARLFFQLRKPVRPGNTTKTSERTTKFATQFRTVVRRGTKTVSRFSDIVTVSSGGIYRAYVQLPKGALASGASPAVLLHSAPASTGKSHSNG